MIPPLLACSVCGDMIFRSQNWWAMAFPTLILVLLLESVAFAVFGRLRKRPAKLTRAKFVVPSLAMPVVGTLIGLGTSVGVWVFLVIALVATVASIIANRHDGALVTAGRGLFVLAGIVLALVLQRPERQGTEDLVHVASYVSQFNIRDGWIYDELKRRQDAEGVVTALLDEQDEDRLGERVRVHANLSLPAAERSAACRRLVEKKVLKADEKACEDVP